MQIIERKLEFINEKRDELVDRKNQANLNNILESPILPLELREHKKS